MRAAGAPRSVGAARAVDVTGAETGYERRSGRVSIELTRVLRMGLLAERCKELRNLFPPFDLFLQVATFLGEPCEYLTEVE